MKKFKASDKTPWFPMGIPPKRTGLYECDGCGRLHMWNGVSWHVEGGWYPPDSYFLYSSKWRGLVKKGGGK